MTNDLDNGSNGVVQEEGKEAEPMFYIKVFAYGTEQTYIVRDGKIPLSAFTADATGAERLDGTPVKLVKDPSFKHYRVLALR
jgi:hypothetical protein